MAEICKKLKECFTSGYHAITDLEYKESMFYDDIVANIEEMNTKWPALEEETRTKIKETIDYFSQFRENEPDEGEFDTIKEQASQLKEEFEALLTRHKKLYSAVKVDQQIVERQYNYSKTMKDQISTHGRNALIAGILLGMIIGGVIAWRTYNEQTIPIVLGVLIGGGAVTIIGGLFYLVLTSVARRGVKKWESLQKRISKHEALRNIIDQKGKNLYAVSMRVDSIINKNTVSVMDKSEALIEKCEEYEKTSL